MKIEDGTSRTVKSRNLEIKDDRSAAKAMVTMEDGKTEFDGVSQSVTPVRARINTNEYPGSVKINS